MVVKPPEKERLRGGTKMPPLDTDPDGVVTEGRVVYLCEACGETFKRERGLVHVTCPGCGTDSVDVAAYV